jgi:hypothetical protein
MIYAVLCIESTGEWNLVKQALTQEQRLGAFRGALSERRRGDPWYVIAMALDEAITGASALGYGEDVVRKIAEDATGLSRGLLTRYLSTIRRVKAAAAAAGLALNEILSPGFNAVETAVRLYDRSPSQGLDILQDLARGRIGLRHVKRAVSQDFELEEASFDPRSRTLRRRGLELQTVEKALALFFPGDWLQRRPPMRYFRHIGWEIRDQDGVCKSGVDVIAAHTDEASSELEAVLPSAALLSHYFPRFYIAFSPNSPRRAADEAVGALELLGLPWFGVIKVQPDLSVDELRKPKGRPDPDRCSEYESLRAQVTIGRHRTW